MPKDFIHITDLTTDEIHSIFKLAELTKKRFGRREKYVPLRGHTLAMIFAKPSARTRISFETGFHRLGGHALYLGPNDIGIGKREAVKDIAQVVSRYNDIIMARLFEHRHMLELAEHATVPVVNGLTDYNHPCQIMADMFTILEHRGNLDDLHITYVGDGNNIVHSWLRLACRLPFKFTVACPEGYQPDTETLDLAREAGLGEITLSHEPMQAVAGADVVYTDVWASMGQESEQGNRTKVFEPFQVNDALLKHAKKDVILMHCLPAHRGEEITEEVLEGPHSVVWDQSENKLHMHKAILEWLMV